MSQVRQAAERSVGPYGFTNGHPMLYSGATDSRAIAPPAAAAEGAKAAPVQGQDYSGTNTHTAGVDEPDLVKTDGKRIVVVLESSLHVIDAATKKETSRLPVDPGAYQILLHGDRVLVLSRAAGKVEPFAADSRVAPGYYAQATKLQLIDLSGMPKQVGEFRIEAELVDARQVASTARVVVRNGPAITFPMYRQNLTDDQRLADNRSLISVAPIEAWLPAYTADGKSGRVDCNDVSIPETFSGTSLVTVLSFDLAGASLSEAEPTAVFADGDTVYGSGANLYLAHDQRWRGWRGPTMWNDPKRTDETEIFQFDITSPKPAYVAGGKVPGWLLNQYSLSEHDGVLRVATTTSAPWDQTQKSSSSVYSLRRDGGSLEKIGSVGGLGKGERIYAVRFVGPIGFVVTFRQTDPLYTIDLSDPTRPRVVGELKIAGYSAYLHPVEGGRLLGIGQDATEQGRVTGTQISLFDVGNLADPKRLDQHKVPRAHSEAEYDPHAFLYWPAAKLLVVPLNNEALLLRVEATTLTELNRISHRDGQIRRSLVIGDTLWTIGHNSVMASTLDGGQRLATITL
ncbi:hypothetical protein Rhe02_92350 [Rhizocola hellebori]|uniref:Benzoate transporter n=1 Tax=Rhizocola hellebori TaxID=1392758 RepID=A0A8J3QKN9_9ACTN|nr:hypothetical protein Rhe02_92350 [Rhizocola hellebori]